MAIQGRVENGPGSVDTRLVSIGSDERVNYGLEIFRGLVGSERFGRVLTALGFTPLQAPFVSKTAGLIEQGGHGFSQGNSVIFRPDNVQELGEGGRHARVYSPREGVVELTAHFPTEERVLAAGLVNWGVKKKDEAEALKPLFEEKKPFLRLVAMDPSVLKEADLKPFVEATHSDEPDLKPKTFISSITSIFKGNPLYKANQVNPETVGVDRYEKGNYRKTEYWVTIPPVEGEGFLLVGKKVNS